MPDFRRSSAKEPHRQFYIIVGERAGVGDFMQPWLIRRFLLVSPSAVCAHLIRGECSNLVHGAGATSRTYRVMLYCVGVCSGIDHLYSGN